MTFGVKSESVARSAMAAFDPSLEDAYASVIRFLSTESGAASAMRGRNAPKIGSDEYIRQQAKNFSIGRAPRAPQPPTTVPDEMVSFILHHYFDIPDDQLKRAQKEHLLSMGAENMVGDLLERYLASVLEPEGWVWCSGSMVKAVDFIHPPEIQGGSWRLLQVKNRDNSENSSASAIRKGTDIEKWFRTFSRRPGSNWAAFPDAPLRSLLSEENFQSYVAKYLSGLRP
jgi:hypothetical protein